MILIVARVAVETRLALAIATIHEQQSPLPCYFGINNPPSGVASGMIPL
jgi:hypothetical protein